MPATLSLTDRLASGISIDEADLAAADRDDLIAVATCADYPESLRDGALLALARTHHADRLTAIYEDLKLRDRVSPGRTPWQTLRARAEQMLVDTLRGEVAAEGTRYFVDDLQTVEPDALPVVKGIVVVVDEERDSMGFQRATVIGPTEEAVTDYVRAQWGEEDPEWFATYVVDRIDRRRESDEAERTEKARTTFVGVNLVTEQVVGIAIDADLIRDAYVITGTHAGDGTTILLDPDGDGTYNGRRAAQIALALDAPVGLGWQFKARS